MSAAKETDDVSPVSFILNIFWIACGGLWMAAGWLLAAVIMAITIVGIPWAKAAVKMAEYTLLPFGFKAVTRPTEDIGTGPLGFVGNAIWLIFAGWWLALAHVDHGRLLADHPDRHSLRLGPSQAGRYCALAHRQDHRSHRHAGAFRRLTRRAVRRGA